VLLYGKVTLPHDTYLSYKHGSSLGTDIFGNIHIMCRDYLMKKRTFCIPLSKKENGILSCTRFYLKSLG